MRTFTLLFSFVLFSFLLINANPISTNNIIINDSVVLPHELDGILTEWPAGKFNISKSNNISFAVDNDDKNLYIALIIPDKKDQIKVMSEGMDMYIDIKGKKKEGKGIKFPLKKGFSYSTPTTQDIKQLRSMMALNFIWLKIFGFSEDDAKDQEIMEANSVNIAFNWDQKNEMCLEYKIPFSVIAANISDLNQKEISLGWQINSPEMQVSTSTRTYTTTQIVSVPAGTSPTSAGRNTTYAPNQHMNPSTFSRSKEDRFWTKYTITIPAIKPQ